MGSFNEYERGNAKVMVVLFDVLMFGMGYLSCYLLTKHFILTRTNTDKPLRKYGKEEYYIISGTRKMIQEAIVSARQKEKKYDKE